MKCSISYCVSVTCRKKFGTMFSLSELSTSCAGLKPVINVQTEGVAG